MIVCIGVGISSETGLASTEILVSYFQCVIMTIHAKLIVECVSSVSTPVLQNHHQCVNSPVCKPTQGIESNPELAINVAKSVSVVMKACKLNNSLVSKECIRYGKNNSTTVHLLKRYIIFNLTNVAFRFCFETKHKFKKVI